MEVYKCFFCGKYGLTKGDAPYITDDDRRKFNKIYGYVNILVGKIGEKWMCEGCKGDLYRLIEDDVSDDIENMTEEY